MSGDVFCRFGFWGVCLGFYMSMEKFCFGFGQGVYNIDFGYQFCFEMILIQGSFFIFRQSLEIFFSKYFCLGFKVYVGWEVGVEAEVVWQFIGVVDNVIGRIQR